MKSNSRRKLARVLLSLCVLTAGYGRAAQDPVEARLQQACVTLQHAPLSMPDLQVLAEVSRSTTNNSDLRSRAMAAYALALLMQGNTNAFIRAVQVQKTSSPDLPSLITIGSGDYSATCTECLGAREKNTRCPLCMGSGKCKTCGGTGKGVGAAGSTSRCPSCTRPGVCTKCNGKKNIGISCPTCTGTGKIFKLSESVQKNYRALLSDIENQCQESSDFAKRLAKVSREKDLDTRIRLLQSLTNCFPKRTDLVQTQELLYQTVAKRDARLKTIQEQQKKLQSEREVMELRKRVATESTVNSIEALRAYLTEHQKTPALKELQLLLDELTYKQHRKQMAFKILIVLAVSVGVLLLILYIQPHLQRKRVQGFQPLPGMRNIDRSKFTDPLTLNAHDSRGRVKTKTAKIPMQK